MTVYASEHHDLRAALAESAGMRQENRHFET
jgi:hypothetical protein